MKIVVAVEGNINIWIKEMIFLTKSEELIKLELNHLTNVRSTPRKTYATYENITMNEETFNGNGYTLEHAKLVSITIDETSICNNVKLSDLHIYDKRDKYEVYIISKEIIENIVIEYS